MFAWGKKKEAVIYEQTVDFANYRCMNEHQNERIERGKWEVKSNTLKEVIVNPTCAEC